MMSFLIITVASLLLFILACEVEKCVQRYKDRQELISGIKCELKKMKSDLNKNK